MPTDLSIRVLIAEDEPIILHNIAKKAAKSGDWIAISGLAESGGEALALLAECPADILITDIEMPGMNGLELIRTVREHYPAMKIIILSGYSNFEYARTALRYGVNDYLLKPVSQETITELLLKLREEIALETASRRREILTLALNGNAGSEEVPSALSDGCFYLVHLTIGNFAGHYAAPEISGEYRALWQRLALEDSLEGYPGLTHVWMIDEAYGLSKFFILHGDEGRLSPGHLRLHLMQYCGKKLVGYPFLLLLAPRVISYHEIWDTARELRRTALSCSRPFVQEGWFYDELAAAHTDNPAELSEALNILRGISGSSAFVQYVSKTLDELLEKKYSSQLLLKFIAESFTAASNTFLADSSHCQAAAASIYGEYYACPDKETLLLMVTERLGRLLDEEAVSLPGDHLCGRITQYIQKNYCSRLSLNDLSEHFGYTSSYINRIFKKELGISPLQYITNLKIEKAKELLGADTGIDIRDVAAATGYEDARYFSRVFKNETGMTPTAFAAAKYEEK